MSRGTANQSNGLLQPAHHKRQEDTTDEFRLERNSCLVLNFSTCVPSITNIVQKNLIQEQTASLTASSTPLISILLVPLPPPPSQPCYRRRSAASAPPQEGCRCFQQCSSTVIVFTSPQGRVRRAARGPPPLVDFTALLSPSPHSPRVFAEEHRPHPGGVQLLSTMRSDHRRLHVALAVPRAGSATQSK